MELIKKLSVLIVFLSFLHESLASPAEERDFQSVPTLDRAQELLGDRVNFLANRLDSFFATERADDELGRSRIRIRTRYDIREKEIPNFDTRYRINIRLPSLEKKFRWETQKETNKETKKDQKKKFPPMDEKASQETWATPLIRNWVFNSDLGVSAAIPPRLIARSRLRRNFTTDHFIHRFVEQVTYITDESGLQEETTFESDHIISENFIFRFVNAKNWRILDKEFTTTHGPTFLHQYSEKDAFNYSLLMTSIIDSGVWFVDNYRLAINYRRNLYKYWAFLDVIPGIDFPKRWSFRRTPFISFQLEILFGGF